jgi:hypothetical protein
MDKDPNPDAPREPQESRGGVLLMRVWNDVEAEMVRQILATHDIPCQVVSDVPHTVLPLTVDGLGEVRIFVSEVHLDKARTLIADHRRRAISIVDGETVPEDDQDPERDDPKDLEDSEG